MDAARKPRMQIFQDEVKLAHTQHWDMDMLSRAELEACMSAQASPAAPPPPAEPPAAMHRAQDDGTAPSSGQALTAWQRFLRLLSGAS